MDNLRRKIAELKNLTEEQRATFMRLGVVQKELNNSSIPLKELCQEIYPEQSYKQSRPILVKNLNKLEKLNLINIEKKFNQKFVSVSEKGTLLFKDIRRSERGYA